MITIIPKDDNRLDIEFSGELDADGMRAALDDLVEHSADIENGKMLYTVTDFQFPTFGAIMIELSRLPKLFHLFRKFDRVALVADKEWVRKAGEFEGKLYPGLKIKAFEPGEESEAEQWLGE